LLIFGLVGLFLIYGIWIEPFLLEVRHLYISNDGLNKVLNGKIAVHLSDLHIGKIGKRKKQVLQTVGEIDPDFIFLTGDYVKWGGNYEPALKFLGALRAELGVWTVMGDYDYSNSRKCCLFCHDQGGGERTRRHNVNFLRNSVEKIDIEGKTVWIGGVDGEFERMFFSGNELFVGENNFPSIILSHNPLAFDSMTEDRDVLILSGDTHGGQIPLPKWLWRILGYEKNAKFSQGFYQDGKKKMYVSRGIGSHLPIRLFRRPELVVLHF